MSHTCRSCNRTFGTQLQLELHRDNCQTDDLFCDKCGTSFPERTATEDGWHYRCPEDDCDGSGIGEDLRRVADARIAQ
jgi:hypothetical protein